MAFLKLGGRQVVGQPSHSNKTFPLIALLPRRSFHLVLLRYTRLNCRLLKEVILFVGSKW